MPDHVRPQLGRLIAAPLAAIGTLAAVLVWEFEHRDIGSMAISVAITVVAAGVMIMVGRRVRRQMDELSAYYEALLRTADEQSRRAEAANRLKDDFLATLSHELRTPLNSILGWSRLVASGKLNAEQHSRAIAAIERAGLTQSRLIEDLLDVSRLVAGRLQLSVHATRLPPLIDAAVRSVEPAARAKQLTLDTAIDRSIGPVAVDDERFQQIAWNLISNAVKFTPPGGRVTVRLDRDGADIRLTVADTGVGFSPDVAAHLFERFRQGDSGTTRQYGGLGLGLGIVRHLIELHGGTVSANSAGKHRGATFEVRLPLREVPAAAAPDQATAARPMDGVRLDGVSVLVVDDDPDSQAVVGRALTERGAIVRNASSAAAAREQMTARPPDVLVCDLLMPDEDGLSLIGSVRALPAARGGAVPAIALTALVRAEDRARALSAGYQMHVAKPIDPEEFSTIVARLAHAGRGEPEDGHRAA